MSANSIVVGNFKGGTGKSTSTQMLGFVNAFYKKRKTLLIDLDPQANASEVMSFTADNLGNHFYQENGFPKTIWNVLYDGSLDGAVLPLIENLDLIAGNIAMSDYSDFMSSKFPNDKLAQFEYFANILAPLKEEYDEIFIDVPPSLGTIVQSAMYFAEYVAIMLQTQPKSIRGAADYIDYMEFFTERYNTQLGIAGIIPFMLDTKTSTESYMYNEAKKLYGDNLINTIVFRSARLIRYDETGITLETKKNGELKKVDANPQNTFISILDELNEHISWFEEE
ncbi:ParA family protein [Enterococcus faecium]|uniref:ParA family protein n=1 Tax=Enterococcus faecium TaxID=1352 RepID=UPI000CF2E92E|nr:ParA family protein [Enterococcus faecium]MBK5028803.1 ParA family protein [Enterococcus faecium]MBK5039484.1 ParA family protein [Enterococcus faecium]MBK5044384.1 ParA family protein [Enterococcus faecium]MBK5069386.1 ParA family protein [Enterococcus faecium]MBK5132577.1 ParA family protein [Enterococcus faecium]